MNFDDNMTEVFDRYLTGQMTEVEEREFLEQLEKDAALNQAYQFHRNIVAGIREARREELKDYIKQNAKIRYMGNVWSTKWVIGSAAVITLFFLSYIVIEYIVKPNSTEYQTADKEQVDSNAGNTTTANNTNTQESQPENDGIAMTEGTQATDGADDGTRPEIKKSVDVYSAVKKDMGRKDWEMAANNTNKESMEVYYVPADTYSYMYNKTGLTLYKVSYDDAIKVFKTEKAAYLGWKKKFYPLTADGVTHPLEEISDTNILKQLPVLK